MSTRPIIDRFKDKVEIKPNGCWEWTGSLSTNGYGFININRKSVRAHRFSYEYFVDEIPKGLCIDHLCRNKRCVNPDHLDVVTHDENIRRGDTNKCGDVNRNKTHCPMGHPYDDNNTYYDTRGNRRCLTCRRTRWLRKSRYLGNKGGGEWLKE